MLWTQERELHQAWLSEDCLFCAVTGFGVSLQKQQISKSFGTLHLGHKGEEQSNLKINGVRRRNQI